VIHPADSLASSPLPGAPEADEADEEDEEAEEEAEAEAATMDGWALVYEAKAVE
jgi:hypothetical protein